MKKLLAFAILAFPSLGWGANSSLTVSSGTFLAVDGFIPANTNFRQAITIADPNVTGGVAPVDPVTGLAVHLATSSATNSIYVINPTTTTVIASTVGVTGTVTANQGTTPWVIGNSTTAVNVLGTVPISGTVGVFQSTFGVVQSSFGVLASTINVVTGTGVILNTTVLASTVGISGTIPTTVSNSTIGVVGTFSLGQSTFGVVNGGSVFQVGNSTIGIVGSFSLGPSTFGVITSSWGVLASTINVVTGTGVTLGVAPHAIITSTIGIVNGGSTFNDTILASTVGIVNGGSVFAIGNSTIGVIQAIGNWTLAQTTVGIVTVNPIQVQNSTIGFVSLVSTLGVVGTLSDNGVAVGTNRLPTLPGVYNDGYGNGTVGTAGNNAAIEIGTDHLEHVAVLPAIIPDSYSGSTTTFSIASDTSDVAAICGNATDIVLIYSIRASCTQTTAGIISLAIVKRSATYAGVWSTMTTVAQDSNYEVPSSTAIFSINSATLVPGALVGYLDNYKLGCMAPGTATPNDIYISPADWRMKPIVLRGISQCVALNIQGATVTGGAMTATFSWMEVPSITP
jgi:hypothetical protein